MSNQVTIAPTIFKDARDNSETYGYRIYDEYSKFYDNNLESIPDDDMAILRIVVEDAEHQHGSLANEEGLYDMLQCIRESQQGITIGSEFYEWEQIKDILG